MTCGIYCIENLENGKKYIGQSVDLERRKNRHYSDLKNNTNTNIHLQNAWNKYGKNAFEYKILLYCESFELTKYEQFFVDLYTPERLYNIRLECVESNRSNVKLTEREVLNILDLYYNQKIKVKEIFNIYSEKISLHCLYPILKGRNWNTTYNIFMEKQSEKNKKRPLKTNPSMAGKNNPNVKLSEKEVLDILDLYYNQKIKVKEILNIYFEKTSLCNIYYILKGETWTATYNKFITESLESKGETNDS